jgi:hypothetical protein
MTRAEWDARWLEHFNMLYHAGYDREKARVKANAIMLNAHGPRPEDVKQTGKGPWWLRIAVSLAAKKLGGLAPLEGNKMAQRIITSLVYGAGAALAAVQVGGVPSTVEGWVGVAGAFVIAFWGKYTDSRTMIAPNLKKPEEK